MSRIKCPECGKENAARNQFCRECGASLNAKIVKSSSADGPETELDIMNVKFLPYLPEEKLQGVSCRKYSLANLFALGVSFQPLTVAIQDVLGKGAGKSGFYFVDTQGMEMFTSNDGPWHIGSLKDASGAVGGGQAKILKGTFDPTMVFMSVALMNIEKQLGEIQQLQQEMMDFMKAQEKAKLRGDINTLIDVFNNFKFNWTNETYKTNKHILVQDIRKDAEQSVQLSRDWLQNVLSKRELLTNDQKVKTKVNKAEEVLNDYRMALFMYAFSSYLEVVLLSNFAENYLNGVVERIEDLCAQYQELYETCYGQLENMSKGTVESRLAGGISGISKGAGEAIGKIPVVKKGPVDEALIAASGKIDEKKRKKTERELSRLESLAENETTKFIQQIAELNRLNNTPQEIYFDQENLYLMNAG